MSGRAFFKAGMNIVGDLADDIVFPQIFAPLFGDGFFAVQHTENMTGDASGGIAVAGDVDRFQHSGFEIPLVMQGAVYADSQCFFRHPAFAEFCNVYGGSGFADSCKGFGGIRDIFQMFFHRIQCGSKRLAATQICYKHGKSTSGAYTGRMSVGDG